MKRFVQISVVVAGFGLAWAAASLAMEWNDARLTGPEADGGMAAGGALILFIAVFGAVSVVPGALALFFLRNNPTFWKVLSGSALVFAATGPLAVLTTTALSGELSQLAYLRVLASLFALPALLVTTAVAPRRRVLLIASGLELTVCLWLALRVLFMR